MKNTETNSIITWSPAKRGLPDSDITVLVHLADGEVWTGFHDGEVWRFVSGDRIESQVVHWAPFPEPPTKQPEKLIELPSDHSKWATYIQPSVTQ
jgi:hypothetical protein